MADKAYRIKKYDGTNARAKMIVALGTYSELSSPSALPYYRIKDFMPRIWATYANRAKWMSKYSFALVKLLKVGVIERKLRTKHTFEYRLTKAGWSVYTELMELRDWKDFSRTLSKKYKPKKKG
jgi:hypothetical protein